MNNKRRQLPEKQLQHMEKRAGLGIRASNLARRAADKQIERCGICYAYRHPDRCIAVGGSIRPDGRPTRPFRWCPLFEKKIEGQKLQTIRAPWWWRLSWWERAVMLAATIAALACGVQIARELLELL